MGWADGRLCGFDTETTGADRDTARIVTATLVFVGAGKPTETIDFLIDPGVEIPAEATAIHGITTEQARAGGRKPAEAIREIARRLATAWSDRIPVIGYNVSYDFTVLDRELRRHCGTALTISGPVVDPHVIDRALDHRRGRRTLEETCRHYKVRHGGAHDAAEDALAAARLAWRLARKYPAEVGDADLAKLYRDQIGWSRQWADKLTSYWRSQGQNKPADGSWPLRPAA
ncbi:3'-5' exonuclease [Actinomadura craniellae]|uniref:3'-5' exonuclease n=1 Tax=Actinomadura craniellae TaxID=2231787 RepID=A0A365GXL1_9ACTN|nr:3'-5' exonuclease [Actinomadura craniellae]